MVVSMHDVNNLMDWYYQR